MDADVKQYLEAMEGRMNERFRKLESGLEARLVETMREVQTELLRAFATASEDQTIWFQKM